MKLVNPNNISKKVSWINICHIHDPNFWLILKIIGVGIENGDKRKKL